MKSLYYYITLTFMFLLSVGGVFFLSTFYHEWLHFKDLKTKDDASLCWDYSNNSIMYVKGDFGNITDEEIVLKHFGIYYNEGFFNGILLFMDIFIFALLLIFGRE